MQSMKLQWMLLYEQLIWIPRNVRNSLRFLSAFLGVNWTLLDLSKSDPTSTIELSSMLNSENSYRIFIFLAETIKTHSPNPYSNIKNQNNISNIRLKRLPASQFAARNRNAHIWWLIINISLRKQNTFNQTLWLNEFSNILAMCE